MRPNCLWRRLIAEWKIKVFLGGGITAAFWIGYFLLERLPEASVTEMPQLAVDRLIPFQPEAAFIYVSQFVTMPLVIWLMTSRRQLLACCRGWPADCRQLHHLLFLADFYCTTRRRFPAAISSMI